MRSTAKAGMFGDAATEGVDRLGTGHREQRCTDTVEQSVMILAYMYDVVELIW